MQVQGARAEEKFITIGTASQLGVYYPAGGAICRLVKRGIKEHGIHCFVERTSGSVYNLKALRSGHLELAMAQGDWLYQSYEGSPPFTKAGADKELRALFSLHTEAFTVIVRQDKRIRNINDLKRKRIGMGADGSGMRATAEEFIKAMGWKNSNFASVTMMKPLELGNALCADKVDAIFFTTGHPSGAMQDITTGCDVRLLSVSGPKIDALMKEKPYYVSVQLPGGMYKGTPDSVTTFGVKAVLVGTEKVSEDIIYEVVKAVFDNLDNFKTLHPVFSSLSKEGMVKEGIIVPLHPGALRYFQENNLLKE